MAILHHSVLTAKNPKHEKCPAGKASRCYHQKAVGNGKVLEVPPNHDPIPEDPIPEELTEELDPAGPSKDQWGFTSVTLTFS